MVTGRSRTAAWALVGTALVVSVAYPLVRLLMTAAEDVDGLARALASPRTISATTNTLWVVATATVASVGFGTVSAVVVHRSGRRWLGLAMLSPMLVPPFVSAMSWVDAYAVGGIVHDWLGVALPGLFGGFGIAAVIAVNATPIVFLILTAALSTRRENDLTEAARASGASAVVALATVTLPLARRALLGAAGVVVVIAANAFGVPAVLGIPSGFNTITTLIYRDLAFSADPTAFLRAVGMSAVLMVASLCVAVGIEARWRRPAYLVGPDGGPQRRDPGLRKWSILLWGYWAISVAVPLLALVLRALVRAPGVSARPENWTLGHFQTALSPLALRAGANTVLLAALAAAACVVVGVGLVLLRHGSVGRALRLAPLATFAVPGSALAVAVLLAYGSFLRDTLLLVLIAYIGKFWVLAHRPMHGAIERLPLELSRAARASGADRRTVVATVQLPVLRPAVLTAWLLVFVFALHEITVSILLFGPGSETLPTVILNMRQLGEPSTTAALALVMTAGVAAGSAPLLWMAQRRLTDRR